jgi:hypothetical protein
MVDDEMDTPPSGVNAQKIVCEPNSVKGNIHDEI